MITTERITFAVSVGLVALGLTVYGCTPQAEPSPAKPEVDQGQDEEQVDQGTLPPINHLCRPKLDRRPFNPLGDMLGDVLDRAEQAGRERAAR